MVREVALSLAKARLSELVDDVRRLRHTVVIRKRTRPMVALIDIETLDRLRKLEDEVTGAQLQVALRGRKHDLRKLLSALDLGV
jgi:prevent-host-death family protein